MRLLFLIFLAFTHLGYSQITNGDTKSNETSIYDGTIGSFPIHMELTNQSGQVIGWYDYPGKSTKLRIEGTVNSDGSIDFNEYNYKAQHTGHFSGYISDDQSISGQWNNPDLTKNLTFSLNLTNNTPLITKIDAASERKMFQESKVKGYSKLALWTTIGLILIVSTVIFFLMRAKRKLKEKPKEVHTKEIIREVQFVNDSITTDEIRKKQGDLFQEYIVKMFHQKSEFFEWIDSTRDLKYGDLYPKSNFNPDLIIRFKYEKKNWQEDIAVECKYRSGERNGIVKIDSERKIENYKNFERNQKIRTFLALGFGGIVTEPKFIFVIPIEKVKSEMTMEELSQFLNKKRYFYYEYREKILS